VLHASHVDASDEQVGHLVTIIGRVELPINRYRYNTVDPARDDLSLTTTSPRPGSMRRHARRPNIPRPGPPRRRDGGARRHPDEALRSSLTTDQRDARKVKGNGVPCGESHQR
jgi:hypothetical protein